MQLSPLRTTLLIMARLEFDDYLRHLRQESGRFRDVLAGCDPKAPVPTCPEWVAADLLWHLAKVQHFWATIIRTRPAGPAENHAPERPTSYDGLLTAFDQYSADLVQALTSADPAETAWSWSAEQTVGFTFRRQAHEALIHRLDAELVSGTITTMDPALAADGVDEVLDVMFGGTPSWGRFTGLPHYVRVELSDTDEQLWVQLGRFTGTDPDDGVTHDLEDISVVDSPGVEADAVVSGPAAALDAWLWRRGGDSEVTVTGSRDVYDRFRVAVNHPIT